MMYQITLRSVGNPDLGQDPTQPMSPTEVIAVRTLRQAADAARAYIVRHDLGGGNFPTLPVYKGPKVVAKITYNGRIWLPPVAGWNDLDHQDWKKWREVAVAA